jgi:para-aminobenzoate synthetase
LGFIGSNGAADLNVIIRTAVCIEGEGISIGTGGAIVHLSNPIDEYDEIELKAKVIIHSITFHTRSSCCPVVYLRHYCVLFI